MIARRACCRPARPRFAQLCRRCARLHHGARGRCGREDGRPLRPRAGNVGLRGDPYLWRALRERLSETDIPASADGVASLLHAAFGELAGLDLVSGRASSLYRA